MAHTRTPAAIVAWAEAKTPTAPAPRKPAGGAGRVTPDERRAIQLAHLTDGLNISQLAERFGRTRETIGGILKGEDFEQIQQQVQAELVAVARNSLASGVSKAAAAWLRSLDVAADRGDHKPSKELLLHTHVIDPVSDEGRGPQVQIVIGMPGSPAGPAPIFVSPLEAQGHLIIDVASSAPALPARTETDVSALHARIAELEAELRSRPVH
jgi:BMFP domain-containing protein YqiC